MEQTENKQPQEAAEETAEAAKAPEAAEQPPVSENKKKKESHKESKEKAALEAVKAELAKEQDAMLRLAAEYDNFRKRSQKEKDEIYTNAKADVVAKFLPVFDNLERALQQATEDEAYKKGVEMTMTGLREVMTALGVEEFGQAGDPFDPNQHNAVMHTEDDSLGENTVSQVFAKGFRVGEKVIRFAMVQVAN